LSQSLWIFGALLWAYVVLGRFVATYALPESLALPTLLAVLGLAVFRALELPRNTGAAWPRRAAPIAAGLGLFVLVLLIAVSLAATAGPHPGALDVALWFVAAFALFIGRQRARRDLPGRAATLLGYFVWAACGAATLFALLSGL
jgi:hypothetical protein